MNVVTMATKHMFCVIAFIADGHLPQVIHRRLRFSLERAPGAVDLLDCSKKTLRIEPLVSVEGLEKFLNGVVSDEGLAGSLVLRCHFLPTADAVGCQTVVRLRPLLLPLCPRGPGTAHSAYLQENLRLRQEWHHLLDWVQCKVCGWQ